jgi:hypothetical protein
MVKPKSKNEKGALFFKAIICLLLIFSLSGLVVACKDNAAPTASVKPTPGSTGVKDSLQVFSII